MATATVEQRVIDIRSLSQLTEEMADISPDTLCRMSLDSGDLGIEVQSPTVDSKTGDLLFWATAVDKKKAPNRRGFIFDWKKTEDVKLDSFLANPVLLWRHEDGGGWTGPGLYHGMPIGSIDKVQVTRSQVRMLCRMPGGDDYPELEPVRVRIRDGLLRAVSIGFYIRAMEDVRDKDGKLHAVKITVFEIVELSVCPIGAHESSLIQQEMPEGVDLREKANAIQANARHLWETIELFDSEEGGRCGSLYRSLTADSERYGKEIPKTTGVEVGSLASSDEQQLTERPAASQPPSQSTPSVEDLNIAIATLEAARDIVVTQAARDSTPVVAGNSDAESTTTGKVIQPPPTAELTHTPDSRDVDKLVQSIEPLLRAYVRQTLKSEGTERAKRSLFASEVAQTLVKPNRRFNTDG